MAPAHHAVPVHAARRLRNRVARAVVALRPVQRLLAHVPRDDAEHPERDPGEPPLAAQLRRVTGRRDPFARAPCARHLLPRLAQLFPEGDGHGPAHANEARAGRRAHEDAPKEGDGGERSRPRSVGGQPVE